MIFKEDAYLEVFPPQKAEAKQVSDADTEMVEDVKEENTPSISDDTIEVEAPEGEADSGNTGNDTVV